MFFYKAIQHLFTLIMLFLLTCCTLSSKEKDLKQTAESFALNLYSWQLDHAMSQCTPSSKKAIQFLASNLSEQDVALIQAQEAYPEVEVSFDNPQKEDTLVTIYIKVQGALLMKQLGKPLQPTDNAYFSVNMIYKYNEWKADALSIKEYANKPPKMK